MNGLGNVGQKVAQTCGKILFLTLLNLLFWTPGWAATTAVVGNGTPASCTEAALLSALDAGGTITFNCGAAAHTITFTDDYRIDVDVTLDGSGLIFLSGGNVQGIFTIPQESAATLRGLSLLNAPGKAIFNSGTLTVEQTIFRDNPGGAIYNAGGTILVVDSDFSENSAAAGGAITNENEGTLSVAGSTFTNNFNLGSGSGGAIYSAGGTATTIVNSLFEENTSADGFAGAIYNGGTMTIEHTVVRNNEAFGGGGIYNGGIMTVTTSHINGNNATGSGGGGITHFNQSAAPSKLTLTQSTVDNNQSQQSGGGIWFSGEEASLEVINSTIFSNTTDTIGGGGLAVVNGDATLTNVTFNANVSVETGGDNIENSADLPGTITLYNTLVVNTDGNSGCAGGVVDGDGNLEFPGTSCGFDTPSADPGLEALAFNGGWTPTHAIAEDGPAQNTGVNANCPATDQRGILRPQFTTCDIGAFEWGALPILTSITPTSTLALSPTLTLVVNGSNFIPGNPATRVLWNGEHLPTDYVNGTTLHASIDASLIITSRQVTITVITPVIDGGTSEHAEIFTIFKRDQEIDLEPLANRPLEPATFNVNATASSALTVTFTATGVCTVTGNTVTLIGELGTCTLTAQQPGNGSYNPAPNASQSFEVVDLKSLALPFVRK